MKYFKSELWTGMQSDETFAESSKQWDENVLAYQKQLEQLSGRLSKRNQEFFNNLSLHDGRLLSFQILDETARLMKNNGSYQKTKYFNYPLIIRLEVLSDKYLYELKFSKIRTFNIQYSGGNNLLPPFTNDFGDWGYAELTDGGDHFLSYEILFSSGSTLRIVFKSFCYRRKKFLKG